MKIKKTFQGNLPENKVLNSKSESQTDAYSCDYINRTLLQGEIQNGIVLWENPDSTVNFNSQTIKLSSEDYDYLVWYYKVGIGGGQINTIQVIKGSSIAFEFVNVYQTGRYFGTRYADFVSNTEYLVKDACSYSGAANKTEVNNGFCIPVKIVGYKNTIPAVVAKEEEIYSTEEQVIGTWHDGRKIYRRVITGTIPSNNGYMVLTNTSDIYHVLSSKGCIYNDAGSLEIGKTETVDGTTDYQYGSRVSNYQNNIELSVGSQLWGRSFEIAFEYTKTTD